MLLLYNKRTLRRWWKRFNEEDWDLIDISQKPKKLNIKFSEEERKVIRGVKKILGLSKGSKMEGIKLKWVRFERENPNYMWQIDGDENDDGSWRVPVLDDCSRYCFGVYEIKDNTTEAMIKILGDCIRRHGKPREILTDNGPEFGGTSSDSEFDKWCEKQGIIHIRSGVHKPTTVGKVSAIQKTIQAELPH